MQREFRLYNQQNHQQTGAVLDHTLSLLPTNEKEAPDRLENQFATMEISGQPNVSQASSDVPTYGVTVHLVVGVSKYPQ